MQIDPVCGMQVDEKVEVMVTFFPKNKRCINGKRNKDPTYK